MVASMVLRDVPSALDGQVRLATTADADRDVLPIPAASAEPGRGCAHIQRDGGRPAPVSRKIDIEAGQPPGLSGQERAGKLHSPRAVDVVAIARGPAQPIAECVAGVPGIDAGVLHKDTERMGATRLNDSRGKVVDLQRIPALVRRLSIPRSIPDVDIGVVVNQDLKRIAPDDAPGSAGRVVGIVLRVAQRPATGAFLAEAYAVAAGIAAAGTLTDGIGHSDQIGAGAGQGGGGTVIEVLRIDGIAVGVAIGAQVDLPLHGSVDDRPEVSIVAFHAVVAKGHVDLIASRIVDDSCTAAVVSVGASGNGLGCYGFGASGWVSWGITARR